MAEETKPVVEVPKDVAAPAAETAVEAKPVETTEPVAAAPATEAAPVVEAPATTTTETPAPAAATTDAVEEAPAATTAVEEVKKEEVVPVEEGQLEHKGLNFPKNFIYSKQFFWFGSDAVDAKSLSHYRRSEKSAEAGHHNTAWASHTGKGLLFFGEKSAPVGVINLADATEPTTDGPTKFNFTSKGGKHAFKAANTADRDNWVSQLKLKIAEAKELASTITETETYKSTLESFKPAAPAKKEEAPAAAPAETTEAAAPVEAPAAVPTIETPPAVAEETTKEAPKERRSASRKRQSIFGSFFGQKEESKKEDKATEAVSPGTEAPKEEAAPAAAEPVVAPAPVEAAAPVAEAPATTEAAVEDKPVEKKEEKPVPTKRNSIFGVFGKKEKKAADAAAAEPAKETEAPVSSETAPALPPVETSTPLGEAVADATPAAVEAPKEEAAPATNGETKKDVKAEKRKSSLPFAFGKKDKSPSTSDEEGDKPEKTGPFSKLRATIKARGRSEKPVEKPEEKAEEKPVEAAPVAEASTSTEPAAEVAAKPAAEETVNKPAAAAPAAPVVTAAA